MDGRISSALEVAIVHCTFCYHFYCVLRSIVLKSFSSDMCSSSHDSSVEVAKPKLVQHGNHLADGLDLALYITCILPSGCMFYAGSEVFYGARIAFELELDDPTIPPFSTRPATPHQN